MAALLKYQGKDGMWRELIDHEEAWPESLRLPPCSRSHLISGVKNGWLDTRRLRPRRAQGLDRGGRLRWTRTASLTKRLRGHRQEEKTTCRSTSIASAEPATSMARRRSVGCFGLAQIGRLLSIVVPPGLKRETWGTKRLVTSDL